MSGPGQPLKDGSTGQPENPTLQNYEGPESSSTSPETPSSGDSIQPRSEAEKAGAVAELLNGGGDPAPDDHGGASGPDDPASMSGDEWDDAGDIEAARDRLDADGGAPGDAPATFGDMFEGAGLSAEDAFKLTLNTGDGETVTIGQMKDAWQERQSAAQETVRKAAELDQRESAIIGEQQLWSELGDQLKQVLTPEQQTKLSERLAGRVNDERRKMVEAMPEMADPAYFAQFSEDAGELLEGYGWSNAEIATMADARQVQFVRDHLRLKRWRDKLLEYRPGNKPPKSGKPTRSGGKRNGAADRRRAASGSEADKINAVSSILDG